MTAFRNLTRPSPAGSWRPLLVIILLAAAALACNTPFGESDDAGVESVAPLPAIRPELALPEGWSTVEADGGAIVAAADPADLDESASPAARV